MKKTYIKLISFFLLFLAINWLLHHLYKIKIYDRTDNARKELEFREYNGNLKYLFMGDSHSQNAINPVIIGNSFNFSSANENFIQTYFKLKAVVNDLGKNPEFIILPIDPSGFSSFRSERFINPSELLTFSDYFEIAVEEKKPAYIRTWLEEMFFMYVGKYNTVHRFLRVQREKDFSTMQLGFKGRAGDLTEAADIQKVCEKKAELYLAGQDHFDEVLQHYFEKILIFCNDHNINVYLMKMPMAREYIHAVNQMFPVNDYYAEIYDIAGRYQSVKHIFDFQDYFFDQQYYLRNPDHLNYEGAKIFSEMLLKEFQQIESSLTGLKNQHENTI